MTFWNCRNIFRNDPVNASDAIASPPPGGADRPEPGTQLATLLFTDIVDSTALKHRLGDRGSAALFMEHHTLVRDVLRRFQGGHEIETAGDSFLTVFSTPSEAVLFSLTLQKELEHWNARFGAEIADRIGIHVGEVVLRKTSQASKPRDLYGIQIDTCARVMSLATGGQILMTRFAFDNARQVLRGQDLAGVGPVQWFNHGLYLLKGVEEPVEICEVKSGTGAPASPPPTTDKAQRYPLPREKAGPSDQPASVSVAPRTLFSRREAQRAGAVADPKLAHDATAHLASMAVLPFVNMSADPENEFLSDGITEDLITALSRVPGLRVPARTSAFVFKGKTEDMRVIGQKLNVESVLEGSVRQSGHRLRVTAQLINVADGFHLWSERYDREMADVFSIQDDITEAIVGALKFRVAAELERPAAKHYSPDAETYQLYLKSRFCISKLTQEGLRKGLRLIEEASRREPNYPMPYISQATAYFVLSLFGYLRPKEGLPHSQAAVQRALELDDTIAEAHTQLALNRFMFDWDWSGAERAFHRALELDPNNAEAHHWFGMFLWSMTRYEESLAEAKKALELDPLSLLFAMDVGFPLISLKRVAEAIEQADKLISLEPGFWGGYRLRAMAKVACGEREEAIPDLERGVALGGGPLMVAHLISALTKVGRVDEAHGLLEGLKRLGTEQYVPPFVWVVFYLRSGDREQFLAWWDRAVEERDLFLSSAKAILETWAPDTPETPTLLRKIGL